MVRKSLTLVNAEHKALVADVVPLIEAGRAAAARSVNSVMTTTYWHVGRVIVEREQRGARRAEYGAAVLERLAETLTGRYGRGFSRRNIEQMRAFYLAWPIPQTASAISPARKGADTVCAFQRPFVRAALVPLRPPALREQRERPHVLRDRGAARRLDHSAAFTADRDAVLRTHRPLEEQGRDARKGERRRSTDALSPEEELKDPFVLEFLGLRDEYSESELEDALVRPLENFLLELGGDFTFVGRQRRLRVGNAWYRIDLLFFHRALRCLVVIDLKLGAFTHAVAGQMHLYLNYAREHWTRPGENPPVGLILCAEKDEAVARYALDGLPSKILAAEYRTKLPREKVLVAEIEKTRRLLAERNGAR